MTRFKKYLRLKGDRLECDYPFMPYSEGKTPALESVIVDSAAALISYVYVVGILTKTYDRSGHVTVDFD